MANKASKAKSTEVRKDLKSATGPGWDYSKWIAFLFPLLLFLNTVPNDYNLDDELVTVNHRLTSKGFSAIPDIFSSPYYEDASGYAYEYRPMVLTSFAMEHQIFGDNPHVSHFLNIILYALACMLLFLILRRLLEFLPAYLSLIISLLFAAHTSHTEVVCSIKNRDEILALLFGLLSLHMMLGYVASHSKMKLLLIPLFFAMALMSKMSILSFALICPMALIFFTKAGVRDITRILLLLLVPIIALLYISNRNERILDCIYLVMAVLFFYVAARYNESLASISAVRRKVAALNITTLWRVEDFRLDSFSPDTFFRGIVPPVSVFSVPAMLVTILPGIVYIWAAVQWHMLAVLPLLLWLLALSLYRGVAVSFWATLMLNGCLVFIILIDPLGDHRFYWDSSYYKNWILAFFIMQMFYRNRVLVIPAMAAALATIAIDFGFLYDASLHIVANVMNNLSSGLLVLFIVCFHKRFKDIKYLFVFIAFSLAGIYNSSLMVIPVLVLLAFYFLPQLKPYGKYLTLVVLVISIGNFYGSSHSPVSSYSIQTVAGPVTKAVKSNPNLIRSAQNRPLVYVEEVVDANSPINLRVGTSLEILLYYFQKVIIPYPLSFYYGYRYIKPQGIAEAVPLISMVIYIILGLLAIIALYADRLISFGIFIYLISISIFANFFEPIPGMLADRFLLVPSLGWVIVLVAAWYRFVAHKKLSWKDVTPVARYTAIGIISIYSCATFPRNMQWKNDLTLFRHDISYVEESSQAHNLLALHLMKQSYDPAYAAEQTSMRQEAAYHFKRAIEIYPPFFNANYDLGRSYMILNQPDSALVPFKKAYELNPDFTTIGMVLGEIYNSKGKLDEAVTYYRGVQQKRPGEFSSYDHLCYVYLQEKKYDLARGVAQEAITNIAGDPSPYIVMGKIYMDEGMRDSAAVWLSKGLQVFPGNRDLQSFLNAVKK